MENKKKMIAAVSAVVQYIKAEEDERAMKSGVHDTVDPWKMSGRQDQMQMRMMMQQKTSRKMRLGL